MINDKHIFIQNSWYTCPTHLSKYFHRYVIYKFAYPLTGNGIDIGKKLKMSDRTDWRGRVILIRLMDSQWNNWQQIYLTWRKGRQLSVQIYWVQKWSFCVVDSKNAFCVYKKSRIFHRNLPKNETKSNVAKVKSKKKYAL